MKKDKAGGEAARAGHDESLRQSRHHSYKIGLISLLATPCDGTLLGYGDDMHCSAVLCSTMVRQPIYAMRYDAFCDVTLRNAMLYYAMRGCAMLCEAVLCLSGFG